VQQQLTQQQQQQQQQVLDAAQTVRSRSRRRGRGQEQQQQSPLVLRRCSSNAAEIGTDFSKHAASLSAAAAAQVIELPLKHPELFESLGIAQPKVRRRGRRARPAGGRAAAAVEQGTAGHAVAHCSGC
jgi:hypothetical protein